MKYQFSDMDMNEGFVIVKKTIGKTQFSKGPLPLFLLSVLWGLLMLPGTTGAQSTSSATLDKEIRKLEADQVEYLMNGNVAEMRKNWASDFTVNNPFNVVQDGATGPIQAGTLTYSKFERNIEKILFHDAVVVVMGNELIVTKTAPKGSSHDTDQPIRRRFTSVWMNKEGTWLLIARHANGICPD